MPSPRKVSPAPRRSASTSFLNDRSIALILAAIRREQISGATDGADHRGVGWIGLDLTPDPRDPHVYRPVKGFPVARFGEIQQALAREHLLGIFCEGLEQREFGRCQRMLVAALITQRLGIDVEPLRSKADQRLIGLRRRNRNRLDD